METYSALLALCAGNSPVTGEFPAQRRVMRSFDVFFDLPLNKRLNKQPWGLWFETQPRPLWRHCNGEPSHIESVTQSLYIHLLLAWTMERYITKIARQVPLYGNKLHLKYCETYWALKLVSKMIPCEAILRGFLVKYAQISNFWNTGTRWFTIQRQWFRGLVASFSINREISQ